MSADFIPVPTPRHDPRRVEMVRPVRNRDGTRLLSCIVALFIGVFPVVGFAMGFYEGQKVRPLGVCSPRGVE